MKENSLKPYYEIDESTKRMIINWAKSNLGNISFTYYGDDADFQLSEHDNQWVLEITQAKTRQDIYNIIDGEIVYQYSKQLRPRELGDKSVWLA